MFTGFLIPETDCPFSPLRFFILDQPKHLVDMSFITEESTSELLEHAGAQPITLHLGLYYCGVAFVCKQYDCKC